jgi:clan AA aspartic protease
VGTFEVKVGISRTHDSDTVSVSAMVDTGAAHLMMPTSILTQLGLEPSEYIRWVAVGGSEVESGYGMALFTIDNRKWYCPVIFGPEDEYLLGSTALEIFNLTVDPIEEKLVPKKFHARPF